MHDLDLVSEEPLCGGMLHTFRLQNDRMVRAWMPPGHDPSKEALPSFWMQDGQNLFRDEVAFGGVSWGAAGTVSHLIESGTIPRICVIAVDHAGIDRALEYLPEPPGNWDGMRGDMEKTSGGKVNDYTDRVVKDIIPWAEKKFLLSPDPKNRVIGGSSFGGIASLYMAMRHAASFHGALIESPSFWACRGRMMRDVASHQGPWPERLYLAMGGCEYSGTRPGSGEAGDRCNRFLSDACAECAALMTKHGVDATRLDWHVEPGAAHNERDWCRRLARGLRWLFAEGASIAAPQPAPAFWTWPSPVVPGRAFEIYADPSRLKLPNHSATPQAHMGFNSWSCGVQRVTLLPAALPRSKAGGVEWLAGLAYAPLEAQSVDFCLTDGTNWDNNGEQNYQLPVGHN